MEWINLKEHRCPRCSSKLETHGTLSDKHTCTNDHCLFEISDKRFNEIASNQSKKEVRYYNPDQNLSDLNNL